VGGGGGERSSAIKRRILIVDDEEDFRFSVSLVLRAAGYETIEAGDGGEARDLIMNAREDGGPIDVILLDVWMPGMSGVQLLRELREKGISIPTVVTSGYVDEELSQELLGIMYSNFIEKPFMPEDLLRKVDIAMGSKG
jgi:CheY-like chemotaxis protein